MHTYHTFSKDLQTISISVSASDLRTRHATMWSSRSGWRRLNWHHSVISRGQYSLHTYIIQTQEIYTQEIGITPTHLHTLDVEARSAHIYTVYKRNDGAFRGRRLRHKHTHTLGMFWPWYSRWVFLAYLDVSQHPLSVNNQIKRCSGYVVCKTVPFTQSFPWAMRAELHPQFCSRLTGTFIFDEYQACFLVSVG